MEKYFSGYRKNESCLELYKSSRNAIKMQNAKKSDFFTNAKKIILVLVLVLLLSLPLLYPSFWGLLCPPQRATIRLQLHSQHTCLSIHRLQSQHQSGWCPSCLWVVTQPVTCSLPEDDHCNLAG